MRMSDNDLAKFYFVVDFCRKNARQMSHFYGSDKERYERMKGEEQAFTKVIMLLEDGEYMNEQYCICDELERMWKEDE